MARKQQEIKVEIIFLSGDTAHFTREAIKAWEQSEKEKLAKGPQTAWRHEESSKNTRAKSGR